MDVHMVLAEHRYRNALTLARGFAVGFVCAVALVGWLAKFYVG